MMRTFEKTDYEIILNQMKKNYNVVFDKTPAKIGAGEKNWYKHANLVMEHLHIVYDIPYNELEKYIVYHMLDMLMFTEKMILIQYIYSNKIKNTEDNVMNDLIQTIEKYFNRRIIEENGQTAIILNKENSWKIYMKPENNEEKSNDLWNEGEPEDYRLFDKQLNKFDIPDNKVNNIVGFVNMFKNKEMVFKIKDVRQAKNNTGARCGDSTTKADVIKLINKLLEEKAYDDTTEILHFGLCVIMETLMRYFTDIKKDNKIYYLTPEETAINDIARYSRNI